MSKIDYDLSKIKGLVFDVDGVLSPSTVPLGEDGTPCRMVNIKDGYALQLAIRHDYLISIITGGVSEAVRTRYGALGIEDIFMGASMKLPVLQNWCRSNGLMPDEVVYVGDDIPDLECMKFVQLSVCPADAAVDVRRVARYISPVQGGYGVARDILEEVMKARGDWMSSEKSFGW